MMVYIGTHYGAQVEMHWLDGDKRGLKQVIDIFTSKNIDFILLPICDDDLSVEVIQFTQNEKEKYCIICESKRAYFITESLPVDMNIVNLVNDILYQKQGKKQMILKSKFRRVFDEAWNNANEILSEGIPEDDRIICFPLFLKKADDIMADEEKMVDEFSWDDEDPVYEKAKFLYMYKLIADYLYKKYGYSYDDIKFLGELDHHDVETYENDLEWLFDGYCWRSTLRKYEQLK